MDKLGYFLSIFLLFSTTTNTLVVGQGRCAKVTHASPPPDDQYSRDRDLSQKTQRSYQNPDTFISHLDSVDFARSPIGRQPFIQSVQVEPGCKLSLESGQRPGETVQFTEDFQDLQQIGYYKYCLWWQSWANEKIDNACCQCGGCREYRQFRPNYYECAKLFESDDCQVCPSSSSSAHHTLRIGQESRRCYSNIQSLAIKPGCKVTLFNGENYSGESTTITSYNGPFYPTRGWYGKRVCSYRCECPNPVTTTRWTTTTTRRPVIITQSTTEEPETTWPTPQTQPTTTTTTEEPETTWPTPNTQPTTTTEKVETETTWPTPNTQPTTESEEAETDGPVLITTPDDEGSKESEETTWPTPQTQSTTTEVDGPVLVTTTTTTEKSSEVEEIDESEENEVKYDAGSWSEEW